MPRVYHMRATCVGICCGNGNPPTCLTSFFLCCSDGSPGESDSGSVEIGSDDSNGGSNDDRIPGFKNLFHANVGEAAHGPGVAADTDGSDVSSVQVGMAFCGCQPSRIDMY